MGLKHVRDVIVGDPLNKGISGGERKRLCVGIELITEPKLLFLDEPTSGLDSVTALGLIRTLKRLASRAGGAEHLNETGTNEEQQVTSGAHGGGSSGSSSSSSSNSGGAGRNELADAVAGGVGAAGGGGAAGVSSGGGCTIICTIHQPQSKIYYQFDQ